MNSEQMRAFAAVLDCPELRFTPAGTSLNSSDLAAWLRQCAEQRPVAYKHTEPDGSVAHFGADEAPCEKCVPLYAAPVPPQREPVLIDLLTQAEKCLAAGVRVDQTAPDEPPMPVSEWDYEAERLSAEILAWMKVHGIGGSDE